MKKNYSLLLLSYLFTVGIHGQNIKIDSTKNQTLNEIIITENRLQIPFDKTARNIQIITAATIEKLPAKSINEVLNLIAGVDIRQRGPFGTQADISIDGGSFEQTLILLNGIKISDAQTAHHSLNIPVPLDAIERIEVLKGASARIYGINALTGAVNIVTKKVKNNSLNANLYAGSSFKNKEQNDGNGMYWGGGAQIYGTVFKDSHNHLIAFSKDQYNGQRYNSASDTYKGFYQNQIDLNSKNNLQVMAGYIHNAFGANGFYAAPGDKESFEIVNTALASIGSSHKITENFTLKPRISNRYNEDDYRYFRNDLSRARSEHFSNAFSAELHGIYTTKFGNFGLGWESRWEQIESSNLGEHKRNNHGAYAEYRFTIAQKLFVNAGAYANYNSVYGWQVFPGVDLAYQIHSNLNFGVNVGSSQRIPSFTDLYLNQRPGNIGNPDLKSENALQYEAILKYNKKSWLGQVGYFHRNITNFIDWVRQDSTVPYQPFNLGEVRMQGWHAQIKNTFKIATNKSINLGISYYYLQPENLERDSNSTSKYVVENLKHQVIALAGFTSKAFYVQTSHRYQKRELNSGYGITDLRLGYTLNKATIYVDATNVLDVKYKEIAAVPMPSRWISLGLKYNW